MVNDSEEYILDGRLRLQGYISIAELSQSQLDLQSRGKVTFSIINPQGIPTSSSSAAPLRLKGNLIGGRIPTWEHLPVRPR